MNLQTLFLLLASPALGKRALRNRQKKRALGQQTRIIGGHEVRAGEYPWFVQWSGCGASLIHKDIILSAAHCNPQPDNLVHIGATNIGDDEATQGVYARNITERLLHPSYDDSNLENDFLIMKLDSIVPITPITLNEDPNTPRPQDTLTVTGFGLEDEDGYRGSDILMDVSVNAYSHGKCNVMYNGEIVEDVMFCAGVSQGGKDSCQGDSGGPIIDDSGKQLGVVSWGYGCGRAEHPGVYARVSGVMDWIEEMICELSDFKPESCGQQELTDPPTQAPEGSVPVQITLNLDEYPEEVSFDLARGSTTIFSKATDALSGLNSYTETLNLLPGNYKLKLYDSYGDGYCCSHGTGTYVIEALYSNGNEISLAKGDGLYSFSLVVEFFVPQDRNGPQEDPLEPTEGPTTSEAALPPTISDPPVVSDECEDNSTATFMIDSVVGTADCGWLKINMERYKYLCQFLEVAHFCPQSCNACHYF